MLKRSLLVSRCVKPQTNNRISYMDTFEIGDQVVYPNHGVGIIEKISNRLVAGKFERFYPERHPTIARLSTSVWSLIDGKNIVVGYFRRHRRHDYEFAIHTFRKGRVKGSRAATTKLFLRA